jgi:general secretion pathway protein K
MIELLKNNRGVALILTVTIIALIVTLTLHFNAAMRSEIRGASNFRDGLRLACVAKSGFNFGLAILTEDAAENSFDSMHEAWALSKDLSSLSSSFFDGGRFEIEITDLSGRIQINRLITENGDYDPEQKAILLRLLGLIDPDIQSERAEDIADAIKDWMDKDNEITILLQKRSP